MAANLKPPTDMTGPALIEWKRIVAAAKKAGHPLQEADRSILTLYLQLWGMNQLAQEHIRQFGSVVKLSNGVVARSPQFTVAMDTAKQLRGLLADLGCTPASRSFDRSAATTEPPPLSF